VQGDRVNASDKAIAEPTLARAAPAAVPTRHAQVLWLARRYGNRRVAQLLQREPVAAEKPAEQPAAPKLAKGFRWVSLSDARWKPVDDLLTWTRLGWEARSVMRTFNVGLGELDIPPGKKDESAPAFYDAIGNVCYLNLSKPNAEISAYFVHEMHHAKQARTGLSPPAKAFPNTAEHRRKWVAMMVKEEVVGTAMGFEHKRRLEARGLVSRDDTPSGMATYRRVYELWRDRALSEGKDEIAAAAIAREKGEARVAIMMADPGGRQLPELGPPGAVGESYERRYGREFDTSPHAVTE
jgi:hypothetical protein